MGDMGDSMPEHKETQQNGCRPVTGDNGATPQIALDCRPPVAPTDATPEALQSVQMARGVAPVARVAPWRAFDPIAHREDIARILGEAPAAAQFDAHVSDWTDRQERAAVIEFDGERTRREAEKQAGLK